MDYVNVYVTSKRDRIDLLRSHFERDNLDFKVNKISSTTNKSEEVSFQVAEKDRERAREILHETGYLKISSTHGRAEEQGSGKKWVPLLFAVIVLLLVIIAVWWFMNAPAE